MTLTQVSTWFANARRRLKKENKWSPDGSCDDGSDAGDSNSLPDSAQTSRLPSTQPSTLPDESGYSSSDRDAGSPHPAKGESPQKAPEVVTIPSRPPVVPEIPAHLTHLHPYAFPAHALAMSQMMSQSVPEAPKMPRFLPSSANVSPPKPAQKRAARSLWSIADITDDKSSVEDNEEVDVTA